jgi:hypothetical protein
VKPYRLNMVGRVARMFGSSSTKRSRFKGAFGLWLPDNRADVTQEQYAFSGFCSIQYIPYYLRTNRARNFSTLDSFR